MAEALRERRNEAERAAPIIMTPFDRYVWGPQEGRLIVPAGVTIPTFFTFKNLGRIRALPERLIFEGDISHVRIRELGNGSDKYVMGSVGCSAEMFVPEVTEGHITFKSVPNAGELMLGVVNVGPADVGIEPGFYAQFMKDGMGDAELRSDPVDRYPWGPEEGRQTIPAGGSKPFTWKLSGRPEGVPERVIFSGDLTNIRITAFTDGSKQYVMGKLGCTAALFVEQVTDGHITFEPIKDSATLSMIVANVGPSAVDIEPGFYSQFQKR